MASISLMKIAEKMKLENLTPEINLKGIKVTLPDINRPALPMAGYFEHFEATRLQVIGFVEYSYVKRMSEKEEKEMLEKLLDYPIPGIIFCRELHPDELFRQIAIEKGVPLLMTKRATSSFTAELIRWLNVKLAPCISVHGVLVDVYGEGVLITGESGIGKSEAALELIKRGHRLVTDDVVEIRKVSEETLVGTAPDITKHFIELRGIGVINVAKLFGMGAVKDSCNIDLIINMVPWRDGEAYDRLGIETQYTEILDVKVPSITIPITPGRNLAVIFEVAAINNRQKRMGYNAALEFTEQMGKFFANKDD